MTYFKKTIELTDLEKKKVSDMVAKMQLWILEGQSIDYMAKELKMSPQCIFDNMFEVQREFRKKLGFKRLLKMWWIKHKH